jgi:hypothetical protein
MFPDTKIQNCAEVTYLLLKVTPDNLIRVRMQGDVISKSSSTPAALSKLNT